jgi:hypothetical protein
VATVADRVVEALRAVHIPPEHQGAARVRRLSPPERRFYFWILREFAAAVPPSADAMRTAAASFGLGPEQALALLAREDLVHANADGRPMVAYPFSSDQRGHRVVINGRYAVQAMCAIDALGIAPMLNLPIEVVSHDPLSGGEVRVQLSPGQPAVWQPHGAIVLAGSVCADGPTFRGCCDVLNFFESPETAEGYLLEHAEISGSPISIPDAAEAGRVVFGGVLEAG